MTICGISLRRFAMVGALMLCAAAVTASSGFAGKPAPITCQAKDGHASYKGDGHALGDALDSSVAGDTIQITGNCTGTYTVWRSVTIVGKTRAMGDGISSDGGGTVITVNGATLTLNNVYVQGGQAGPGVAGGGVIVNGGGLNMIGASVRNNSAGAAGGIFNNGGAVSLSNSSVTGNTANTFYGGGGIANYAGGSLTLDSSSVVSGNSALVGNGGGIYNGAGGTANIGGASVSSNSASSGLGGGIFADSGATTSGSLLGVSGNTPDNCNGAVSC